MEARDGDESSRIGLVSVNVGVPRRIGDHAGRPVRSAIGKSPVAGVESLELTGLNLAGDRQADLRVHGGPDKALYVYPAATLRAWSAETGRDVPPGFIGENLTVEGVDETGVRIGDVWAWGEAEIQVCQPRSPCYKLAVQTGRPEIVRRFEQLGRCGWYMRVLTPGTVPVAGPLRLVRPDPLRISVRDAQRAARSAGLSRAEAEAVAAHPALAEAWRRSVRRRLDRDHEAA